MSRGTFVGGLLFVVLLSHAPSAGASAFCDCCCKAAAGNGAPCPGCDLNGNSQVSRDEVELLGCITNPMCAAIFPPETPPPTPTETASSCVGDCTGDGAVTVDELLTMVNVALGLANATACPAGDANGDGAITIEEILAAINNALNNCPVPTVTATPTVTNTQPLATATPKLTDTPPLGTATPTLSAAPTPSPTRSVTAPAPTATPTPTPTSPASATASPTATGKPSTTPSIGAPSFTPTRTPTAMSTNTPGCASVVEAAAGGSAIIANGMTVIPSVITAIVSGVQFGSSSPPAAQARSGNGKCPSGGTATRTGSIPGSMLITLVDCELATSDGLLVLNGTVSLSGFLSLNMTANVQATLKDSTGTITRLMTSADNLTGTINPQPGGSCYITSADVQLSSGALNSHVPGDDGVTVTFNSAGVAVAVAAFNADCVPVNYALTFNGGATLAISPAGMSAALSTTSSFDVAFSNFTVSQDATMSPTQTQMNGNINVACFDRPIGLMTRAPLTQAVGVPCPTGGTLRVSAATTADIFYLAGGTVGIDTNLDGVSDETFGSCFAAQLLACRTECIPPATATVTPTSVGVATASATSTQSPTTVATPSPTPSVGGSPVPSATPTPTASAPVMPTATFTAKATVTSTPTSTFTQTPTATTTIHVVSFCDSPPEPAIIPDGDPTGINRTITIGDTRTIADLNVRLDVAHPFVGDLKVILTHGGLGTTAVLLDRPGIPATTDGCGRDDIACTFDDEAGRTAEDQCLLSASMNPMPAIDGSVKPNSPLSAFDGQSLAGTWTLSISDNAAQDAGSLFDWCLEVNSPAPVITYFACNGQQTCTIPLGQSFSTAFSFFDPDGNASTWAITAIQDDNQSFPLASGAITPAGSGTIPVDFLPFTCSSGSCRTTEYDFVVTVTDTTGLSSRDTRVHLTVPGTG